MKNRGRKAKLEARRKEEKNNCQFARFGDSNSEQKQAKGEGERVRV